MRKSVLIAREILPAMRCRDGQCIEDGWPVIIPVSALLFGAWLSDDIFEEFVFIAIVEFIESYDLAFSIGWLSQWVFRALIWIPGLFLLGAVFLYIDINEGRFDESVLDQEDADGSLDAY